MTPLDLNSYTLNFDETQVLSTGGALYSLRIRNCKLYAGVAAETLFVIFLSIKDNIMKSAQPPLSTFHPGRHLQILDEKTHDPYQAEEKLSEPAVCDTCGASYQNGRWQWTTPSVDAVQARCPACRRIAEGMPAGYVTIEGKFAQDHHDEVVSLIRNIEDREKPEHPLQRIMSIETEDGKLLVETTDVHLARGIGEALERAYKGELKFHYSEDEHLLRLHWER